MELLRGGFNGGTSEYLDLGRSARVRLREILRVSSQLKKRADPLTPFLQHEEIGGRRGSAPFSTAYFGNERPQRVDPALQKNAKTVFMEYLYICVSYSCLAKIRPTGPLVDELGNPIECE